MRGGSATIAGAQALSGGGEGQDGSILAQESAVMHHQLSAQ